MDLPQEYGITDLYLASYLKARGLQLIDVQKEGRRSRFIFRDAPERNQFVSDYTNDKSLAAFTHALRDLKAAIHNWNGSPPERGADIHKRWR